MLVKNVSKRRYMHAIKVEGDEVIISLDAGATKNIPDEIAEIWIKTNDIVVVDDGSKDAEIERLKAENKRLSEALNAEDNEAESYKKELLEKCKKYGIKVTNPNTKIQTLEKKIAEYESKLAESSAE